MLCKNERAMALTGEKIAHYAQQQVVFKEMNMGFRCFLGGVIL